MCFMCKASNFHFLNNFQKNVFYKVKSDQLKLHQVVLSAAKRDISCYAICVAGI